MSTLNIIFALFAVATIVASLDMFRHFWQVRRLQQMDISIARSLRQAVIAMGPFPDMPETEGLTYSSQ